MSNLQSTKHNSYQKIYTSYFLHLKTSTSTPLHHPHPICTKKQKNKHKDIAGHNHNPSGLSRQGKEKAGRLASAHEEILATQPIKSWSAMCSQTRKHKNYGSG